MVMRRAHHARMQHAGQAHVVEEIRPPPDQRFHRPRRRGGPDMAEGLARPERRIRIDVDAERPAGGEFPIAHLPVGGARVDRAVVHLQGRHIDIEHPRGLLQQVPPRRRRRQSDRTAGLGHRLAAGSKALVRREAGLHPRDLHPARIDTELVRNQQDDGSRDALADIDLAAAHGDGPTGAEGQPVVQRGVGLEAGVSRHRPPRPRAARSPAARRHARRNGRDGP